MEKLITHVTNINAEKVKWMEESGGWTGLYSTDPAYWVERGITTIEELELDEMAQSYSDVYKDVYGSRPRGVMPTGDALKSEMDYLYRRLDDIIEEEKLMQDESARSFELHIENIMGDFNIDRATAIRWDMDACDVNDDIDYYKWIYDLPYSYNLDMKG